MVCPHCNGTGVLDGITCSYCLGTGIAKGIYDTILANGAATVTKLPEGTKLVYTFKIVEVIDATEYAALVDAAKDGLRIILSCGVVDLVSTGKIYLDLMAIFGSSPITKAAIEAL